jgi:hypothetical protein
MTPLMRSIVIGAVAFAAGIFGVLLGQAAPVEMLNAAKGTVGGVIGLVTLLLALVLGFLVYTAFAIYTTQQSEAQSLGPVIADIDLALKQYGPEATGGRIGLRVSLRRARARFFEDAGLGPKMHSFEEIQTTFANLDGYFGSLEPQTDKQRRQLAKAWDLARKYHDVQMTMTRQLASPFPPRVMPIVICWASALFLGYGLLSPANAIAILALFVAALSVASAIFLILELSSPYSGYIRIGSNGLDAVLAAPGDIAPLRKEDELAEGSVV